jgi:hypothetical protein
MLAVPASAETPACIHWWSRAVGGMGYNHVVGIENGCDKPAACTVSTDVAPSPVQATVPAKERVDVMTFRGSPTTVFKPNVACTLQ